MKTYTLLLSLLILSCNNKSPGDIEASIFFIKNDFKRFSYLNDNPERFNQSTKQRAVVIKDIRNASLQPSLKEHGFQFEDFRNSKEAIQLLDAVKKAVTNSTDEGERKKIITGVLGPFEEHIKRWAKKNLPSISFDDVVCGNGFYRNTDPVERMRSGADMQFEIAHIDFYPNQDLYNLFSITGFNEELFRKFGTEARKPTFWNDYKLSQMINVWMPFYTVKAYPLAVLDSTTMNFSDDVIPNLSVVRGIQGEFKSGALRYTDKLQFYFKSLLEKGEAIIFNSFGTIHTAFRLPEQTGERESFDIRCAFIKMQKSK